MTCMQPWWGPCSQHKRHACGKAPGHTDEHVCYACGKGAVNLAYHSPGDKITEHNRRSAFPTPTVGRVVHFYGAVVNPGGDDKIEGPFAAIVTAVGVGQMPSAGDGMSLVVFAPTKHIVVDVAKYSETPKPGCWTWPTEGRDG